MKSRSKITLMFTAGLLAILFIGSLLMGLASGAELPGFQNVKNLGCKTMAEDATFDNAELITEFFRRDNDYAGLAIPTDGFGIATTVLTPQWIGGSLVGAGICQGEADYRYHGDAYLNEVGRQASRLVWTGEDGGAMLRMEALGTHVAGIMLNGRKQRGWGPQAGVGLWVHLRSYTGKMDIDRLSVNECHVAIRHGDLDPDGQKNAACDHAHFGHIMVSGCDTAYQVCHSQSNTHRMESLELRHTRVGFDFAAKEDGYTGGVLDCESVNVSLNGTRCILQIHKPGKSTGSYRIGTIRIDAQVKECKWVEAHNGQAEIIIDRVIDNSKGSHARLHVKGSKVITLSHCTLGDGFIDSEALETEYGYKAPNIVINRARIIAGTRSLRDTIAAAPGQDVGRILFRDATDFHGKPFDDEVFEGVLIPAPADVSGIFKRRVVPQDASFYALAP